MPPLSWYEIEPCVWILGYQTHNWENPPMTIHWFQDTNKFEVTRNLTNTVLGAWDTLEAAKEYAERVLLFG